MKIHLSRAGAPLTIVSLEELKSGYATGQFLPTDLYWYDGLGGWQPLNTFDELNNIHPGSSVASPLPMQETSQVPAAHPTSPAYPTFPQETNLDTVSSTPTPAWEQREELGVVQAAIQTVSQMLLRPTETFPHFQISGGFGKPLSFYLLFGFLGMLATAIYDIIFHVLNLGASSTTALPEATEDIPENLQNILNFFDSFGAAPGIIGTIMGLFFGLIILTIGIFISSGITHVLLMIFGGANKPFEATFRVYAYSFGATFIFLFVPVCGNFIYSIWGLILCIIGLTRIHQTEVWRPILAILTPVLLCCVGVLVLTLTVFASASTFSP